MAEEEIKNVLQVSRGGFRGSCCHRSKRKVECHEEEEEEEEEEEKLVVVVVEHRRKSK